MSRPPIVHPLGKVVNGICHTGSCSLKPQPLLAFEIQGEEVLYCKICADFYFDEGMWRRA